jgi:pyruvate,water dikinase
MLPSRDRKEADMIVWLNDASAADIDSCGGKAASLCRMATLGLPVPPGFVVTADAFAGATISSPLPAALDEAIRGAYEKMGAEICVAVRSSAFGEDSESSSYAGQHETLLNVRGSAGVVCAVKQCWESFYAPRAMFYRMQKGELTDTRMAVVVQEMVPAEKSGVLFTVDPVRKVADHMVVEAVFGLGEGIVSGLITPDHYVIQRRDGALVREFVSTQMVAIVNATDGGTVEMELPEEQGAARVLHDRQLNDLRQIGLRLEQFFGRPQDIEWCLRGGELFVLQSRPITSL